MESKAVKIKHECGHFHSYHMLDYLIGKFKLPREQVIKDMEESPCPECHKEVLQIGELLSYYENAGEDNPGPGIKIMELLSKSMRGSCGDPDCDICDRAEVSEKKNHH
jgi:hypothetical protein